MCDTEEANNRPKWLMELENRKRKPRLAHEAGAGAPCMICSTACPGLDLHFWRKICKNCKCSRDDHDFDDDDFPQFDLLFGSAKKFKRKPILLHVNNEKQHESEAAFEWVPPDTTKELATDYMKALPADKLPIKGSAGAALRRQLLQKQLPLHDIDHKACDELTEQEKKQFEKYLENIKKYVGQGKVTKMLGARPFDRALMTPANATDMQRFSPQHKINTPGSTIQLRTPSSFTPKSSYAKSLYENQNKQLRGVETAETNRDSNRNAATAEKYNLISSCNNSETVRSEPIKPGVSNKISQTTANTAVSTNSSSPSARPINDEDTRIADSILADAFLPPSTVNANDIIGSTLDEKRLMFIREKLSDKYGNQENQTVHNVPNISRDLDASDLLRRVGNVGRSPNPSANIETQGITDDCTQTAGKDERKPIKAERETMKPMSQTVQSIPLNSALINNVNEREKFTESILSDPGATPYQVSKLPESTESFPRIQSLLNNSTGSIELSGSVPSNVIYSEKLDNQIFPHDAVGKINQDTENLPRVDQLKGTMEELVLSSVKPQQKCHKCEEEIRVGDVVVTTDEAKNASWHPGCFVCNMCNELLVDLVYFHYKDKLYCGRDLATLLGIPRCFACDELIFVREYTVAEGHNYHVKHFCCWDCDVPLAGQQYITESDRPLCLPCYQKTYAKTCQACSKVIKADQQGVTVKDLNFHATDACFSCHTCKKNLLNGRMTIKEEKLFCSKECISMFLNPSLK